MHSSPGPVAAPVEDLVPEGEGECQARPGGLVRSLGGVGPKSGVDVFDGDHADYLGLGHGFVLSCGQGGIGGGSMVAVASGQGRPAGLWWVRR